MSSAPRQPGRDSFMASGANLAAGAIELIAGGVSSSWSLFADTTHNVGDSAAYGINGLTAEKSPEIHWKWRKRAATLVCLGALAVGLKSGQELLTEDANRPGPVVPAAAMAAGAISYGVHRRMVHHADLEGGYSDNARHAKWDAYCAPVTIVATTIAASGVPKVDLIGGVIVSGITILANNPWKLE